MTPPKLPGFVGEILELLKNAPAGKELTAPQSKALRVGLTQIASKLSERISELDPAKQPDSFFDPADPRLFGTFAAVALLGQERIPLGNLETRKFYGSGIYAIYYKGPFKLYKPISGSEHPIYVGEAGPMSAHARIPQEQGTTLCGRLNEHRKNIARASDSLKLNDFECRYLVVASGWQKVAESALIGLFHPIWNKETKLIQGFGKHGDAAETRAHPRSPWDVLHEGRKWAAGSQGLGDKKSPAEIEQELKDHFNEHPVVPDMAAILQALLGHIKLPS